MKDTLITARRKKTELLTLLVCFVIGNLANLYAIVSYETPFSEMLTSIFYVLVFSCVLYVFWTILRILFYGIRSLFLKKRHGVEK
ncbi:hypothetical protein AALN73_21505 [Bacteroides stercorirosoris]|jgi:presenilin-like A22 family membrane protease|uniref:Uncharacterized protein n=1 Tax=Bacteroides stercorirosoris TaxID=871324 RepID=A0A413H2N9_9BACE|nr:hypothetical protein [Bacteroides stercorirosoris]OKZ06480.1 MAG: hypothetical protein BHV75_18510 [Bacteroides oleiciplenus]RGX77744.1 hypothetical protein DXA68_14265 [Bacteroides stercorirosoris]